MTGAARGPATTAARQAAAFVACLGTFVLLSPLATGRATPLDTVIGIAGLPAGALLAALPWHRWRPAWTLLAVPVAVALVGAAADADIIGDRAYGACFVLAFAWIGANHPPKVPLLVTPALAVLYELPILVSGARVDLRGLVETLLVGLVVAEALAAALAQVRNQADGAQRSADLFRAVSAGTARLLAERREDVLDSVVRTVMTLGYDGANIAIPDAEAGTFSPRHALGINRRFEGQSYPLTAGTTGEALSTGQVVVCEDYPSSRYALRGIAATGIVSSVAVPIVAGNAVAGVLQAASSSRRQFSDEDVDALRLLAVTAGVAIEAASELDQQREAHRQSATEAVTDALTSVGNRRAADRLLSRLSDGDVVVLLDLDHFKAVNDRRGHAVGDQVLVQFAGHVSSRLRDSDAFARFGGEEFLLVLPQQTTAAAVTVVNRLATAWRETQPVTTFSAGVARHTRGSTVMETLGGADAALYAAKRSGRDRCAVAGVDDQPDEALRATGT